MNNKKSENFEVLFDSQKDSSKNLSDKQNVVLGDNVPPVTSVSPTISSHEEPQQHVANEPKDTDIKLEEDIHDVFLCFDTDDFDSVPSSSTTAIYDDLLLPVDESSLTWSPELDFDFSNTSPTTLSPTTEQLVLDDVSYSEEAVKLADNSTPLSYSNDNNTRRVEVEINESSFIPITSKEDEELLSKRTLPQDSDGDTYLHILLSKEEETYTKQCLLCIPRCITGKKGLDALNNMGQTALHMACYTVNIDVTKALLEHGAEPSLLDKEGNSCLHIACGLNSQPLVTCILSTLQGIEKRKTKDIVNLTNSQGLGAIHIATQKENINMVEVLHEYGGNIDQQDDCFRKTPLMFACESNQEKAVKLFIERLYADVNIRTLCDYSALHIACEENNFEIVEILLKNGAEVGMKTAYLKTEKDLTTNAEVKVLLERYLRKSRKRRIPSSDTYD